MITSIWKNPAVIAPNNFKFKSLSSWSFNPAVGCAHACRFCYVPEVSTNKLAPNLEKLGVTDPDAQWGEYVFPRRWDEGAFMASLRRAEATPLDKLNKDGNRAVMFSTTTDPYQMIPGKPINEESEDVSDRHRLMNVVSNALYSILHHSSLNVRILTRSPLAKIDFDLMKKYRHRLLFGMSLPTLDNRLARIYEPHAPAPTQRLATLKAAKEAGLNVYVAVAPTYPECDEDDMRRTFTAVKELDPLTVFMEPINIRAENVERIRKHAASIGETVKLDVFKTPEKWREYAFGSLVQAETVAAQCGLNDVLHLWPDASLGSKSSLKHLATVFDYEENNLSNEAWLQRWWGRVSEWPK